MDANEEMCFNINKIWRYFFCNHLTVGLYLFKYKLLSFMLIKLYFTASRYFCHITSLPFFTLNFFLKAVIAVIAVNVFMYLCLLGSNFVLQFLVTSDNFSDQSQVL